MERVLSPHSAISRPYVEPIWQPLYSATELDTTLDAEYLFYNYGVGGSVSSTTTAATLVHTNMDQASILATPKLFEIHGIRLVFSELGGVTGVSPLDDTAGQTTGTEGSGAFNSNLLEDVLRVIYASYYNVFIGSKDYLNLPTFLVPGNTGVEGSFAMTSVGGQGAGGTASIALFQRTTAHTVGLYFSIRRHPIQIPPQQTFRAALRFPYATRPTLGAARMVWSVFDGSLGREVQ